MELFDTPERLRLLTFIKVTLNVTVTAGYVPRRGQCLCGRRAGYLPVLESKAVTQAFYS